MACDGFGAVRAESTGARCPLLGREAALLPQFFSPALGVPVSATGVKAATTERFGFMGRGEDIAA